MALRFLYLFFVRVLQLVRLASRDRDEVAVEVAMLRHEVAVLGRQINRPALQLADRALSPDWRDCFPSSGGEDSSFRPRPCAAGTKSGSDAGGRITSVSGGAHRPLRAPSRSSGGAPGGGEPPVGLPEDRGVLTIH